MVISSSCIVAEPCAVAVSVGAVRMSDWTGDFVVDGGVDQRQRDRCHTDRLPIASAGEDDILHAAAAQTLGGLFAEHPADRVTQIRFAATVRARRRRRFQRRGSASPTGRKTT